MTDLPGEVATSFEEYLTIEGEFYERHEQFNYFRKANEGTSKRNIGKWLSFLYVHHIIPQVHKESGSLDTAYYIY